MKTGDRQHVSPAGFYKIILPGIIFQKKLRIPEQFAEAFGDELSGVIALVIPDGCLWLVKLEKSDHMLCFSDGWQKLVDHYSISSGHVLIFKYRGNSCFNVIIFDMTSTEIDYSLHPLVSCAGSDYREPLLVSDEEEIDSNVSIEVLGSSKNSQTNATKASNGLTSHKNLKSRDYCPGNSKRNGNKVMSKSDRGKQVMSETLGKPRAESAGKEEYYMSAGGHMETASRRDRVQSGGGKLSMTADETKQTCTHVANGKDYFDGQGLLRASEEEAAKLGISVWFVEFLRSTVLTNKERKRAIYAARLCSSGKPSFMVVVRHCNLDKIYEMDVPIEFSERFLLPPRSIELEIEGGKRWTVHSMETRGGTGGATIKRGWATFAKQNYLGIGDICVFEAIRDKQVLVLRVSIFRSNQHE